ncbi:hypothetical protein N7454_009508 [Penicillium verhagenii]|nr:hypothetical protein N7454_009508 [Penicillium verhagenii]
MDIYKIFPEPKFRPLHEVLVAVYATHPTIHCAFTESDDRPCQNTVESPDSEAARYWIEKISQCFTGPKKKSPLHDFLFQLAHYCFCDHHAGMSKEGLRYQWVRNLESKDLNIKFISLLTVNFRWPPPPRTLEFRAHRPDCASSKGVETRLEKYERIDKLLEKDLSQPDKDYVYVISSPEAPGKLKIGVSGDSPNKKRLQQHRKCYPNSKLIKFWLVTKYAYRVEQLVLADFEEKHFKLHEKCAVCLASHQEWIEVNEKTLFDCIDEWVDFVQMKSTAWSHDIDFIYDKDGKFNPAAVRYSPHRKKRLIRDINLDPLDKLNRKPREDRGQFLKIPKNSTPVKKSGRSRSVTPVDYSPTKDFDESDSDSPGTPAEDTPTKKGRNVSSRRGAPLNDSPVSSHRYATRSRESSIDPDAVLNESMRKMGLADCTCELHKLWEKQYTKNCMCALCTLKFECEIDVQG